MTFSNEHIISDPRFLDSPGLYSGLSFVGGDASRVWEIDLLELEPGVLNLRHTQHQALEKGLQSTDRDLILCLKAADSYGSTFFSADVYDFAVSDAGDTPEAFADFLHRRRAPQKTLL